MPVSSFPKFSHAATVLPASNLERSLAFYTDKLGFKNTFTWGEPVTYAVLKNEDISIHLSLGPAVNAAADHCTLYIFVYDVAAVHQHCVQAGIPILTPPGERAYAMNDFDITDPDGYIITFGKGG